VKQVIEKTGMESALLKEGEEGLERLENIKELASLASRYDGTPGVGGLSDFLADTALAGDQDELDRDEKSAGVTLMTVHASKGLEFDVVFVTGLEEGLFPHSAREGEERDEEEERRLFYVAVTRAKKKLYLTLARVRKIYGSDFASEPSAFLHDIDSSLVAYAGMENDFEDIIEA
jgi:DNA helicase-2/ATP-dependent DNA helicase PcrA